MKFGKSKNEIYATLKNRTYHLFWCGCSKIMYWIRPHSFDEYIGAFGTRFFAFTWTTFSGFVIFGVGFAISDFEQQKAKMKAGFKAALYN